ncbi:efflux transporter periplasmic adaptor subunit [Niabella ginsenosidivorans]|uniref:Efflux transporter periplasmic adaptor subunit n=1 Tax=Niabella ginsenosidivorans TaxID=1176587 RepID=A0A1A9IB55_9BACT|nr:efflux RND transporter periplasmic adaptor subunit [Niabella ginsenosidivorans]ANH83990.1 efflux transporter periplasmic adaptor subunit [Niabella ginsenosidivorans]
MRGFHLAVFSFVLLAACTSDKNKDNKKENTTRPYQVLTLEPRPAITYHDYPATIQGQQVVEIRPMVDGYLEKIYVPEGAAVQKGQLLFQISNPQYEQEVITAKAAIKSAEADVSAAQMNVEKTKPLVAQDIISKYELESAQYTLKAKEAALAQAKATLANALTNIGYTTIRSPQSGVIGLIPYKIGALVSSTTSSPLTTLSNNTNIYAYFSLNEKQLLNFSSRHPGATMQEKLKSLPPVNLVLADGTLYNQTGKVEPASGSITTATGTITFKATFPNPGGIIQNGASATVRIPRNEAAALMIPQSASFELQDKRLVYKLTADNKIISTAIVSTPTPDGQYLIVQSGLTKGDRIVLDGFNLKDGTQVIPRPVNADSIYHLQDTTQNNP